MFSVPFWFGISSNSVHANVSKVVWTIRYFTGMHVESLAAHFPRDGAARSPSKRCTEKLAISNRNANCGFGFCHSVPGYYCVHINRPQAGLPPFRQRDNGIVLVGSHNGEGSI